MLNFLLSLSCCLFGRTTEVCKKSGDDVQKAMRAAGTYHTRADNNYLQDHRLRSIQNT